MIDNRLGFNLQSGKVTFQQKRMDLRIPGLRGPHWPQSTFQSECKEGIRVLVFLASALYGTLAFFMEAKRMTIKYSVGLYNIKYSKFL